MGEPVGRVDEFSRHKVKTVSTFRKRIVLSRVEPHTGYFVIPLLHLYYEHINTNIYEI